MKLFPFLPYVTVSLIGVYFAYQKGQTVVYEENAKIYAVGIQSARERSDMPRDYLNFLLARYYYSANRASFESQDIQQKVDASALREVPIGKGTAALDEQQAFFRRNGIP